MHVPQGSRTVECQDKRSTFCGTLDYLAPAPWRTRVSSWHFQFAIPSALAGLSTRVMHLFLSVHAGVCFFQEGDDPWYWTRREWRAKTSARVEHRRRQFARDDCVVGRQTCL